MWYNIYRKRVRPSQRKRDDKIMIIAVIAKMLIPVFAVAACILPIYINEEIEMRKRRTKK
jgi:hypothetical protein